MPLSEREQKILQEIERDLYREDPSFARDVRRRQTGWNEVSSARLGAALFVLGLAAMFAFFTSRSLLVGVVAFGAMVAGVVLLAGSFRGLVAQRQQHEQKPRERLVNLLRRWEERVRKRRRGR